MENEWRIDASHACDQFAGKPRIPNALSSMQYRLEVISQNDWLPLNLAHLHLASSNAGAVEKKIPRHLWHSLGVPEHHSNFTPNEKNSFLFSRQNVSEFSLEFTNNMFPLWVARTNLTDDGTQTACSVINSSSSSSSSCSSSSFFWFNENKSSHCTPNGASKWWKFHREYSLSCCCCCLRSWNWCCDPSEIKH